MKSQEGNESRIVCDLCGAGAKLAPARENPARLARAAGWHCAAHGMHGDVCPVCRKLVQPERKNNEHLSTIGDASADCPLRNGGILIQRAAEEESTPCGIDVALDEMTEGPEIKPQYGDKVPPCISGDALQCTDSFVGGQYKMDTWERDCATCDRYEKKIGR